jgi:hypothetical protein
MPVIRYRTRPGASDKYAMRASMCLVGGIIGQWTMFIIRGVNVFLA